MNRRNLLKITGIGLAGAAISSVPVHSAPKIKKSNRVQGIENFIFCLNTSTIRGCIPTPNLKTQIDIASKAGYDAVELWVRDVKAYLDEGNSSDQLKKYMEEKNITVENAIGFAKWMIEDEESRKAGMVQLKEEMEMMGSIGCKRIAAAPSGVDAPIDIIKAGQYYKQVIDLGRETGVMPQLEFWGAHEHFFHFSQIVAVAAAANDPEAKLLPDIYHLFRGGSGFDCLQLVSGNAIDVFHMNDYTDTIPRLEQKDKDRVYPGDGVAPIRDVLYLLNQMQEPKVLSIELFNPEYWKQDALVIATTALNKLKDQVYSILNFGA